jgi:pimeloyl-ACP methyl ester carboxylesterase
MYAELSRLTMYYEEYGAPSKPSVVLLHGGMSGAQTWAGQIEPLSQRYHILVPEQQGHAHTPDLALPLTYQAMTNDTIEFLETIAGGKAHLVGHSDGGILALFIALQRPDLLERAVVIGANYHKDGLFWPALTHASPDDEEFATGRNRYGAISPEGPEHWPVIFAKTQQMWLTEPSLSLSDIARITAPVLVMVGDDDVIAHSHSVELYEALAEGQMAMIPGTSHGVKKEKPEIVNRLILEFLADDVMPSVLKSVRTAR